MQVETTEAFDAWLDSLKDHMTRIRLSRRLDKAMRGTQVTLESEMNMINVMRRPGFVSGGSKAAL